MEGGPSHIDTFDPKPKLRALDMTESASSMGIGRRRYVGSPFQFRRAGKVGIEINEGFEQLSEVVDDICFYRGLQAGGANHSIALDQLNFGMRAEMPAANPAADSVARRCLLARQRIEAGDRFVQVTIGGWDSHQDIAAGHGARIRDIDKPVAALIKDLKRTGLLDETLVVWTGEFGRSPDNWLSADAKAPGRDHNAKAMTVWLAGGGAPRGKIVGATDELGATAVDAVHPMKDFHATLRYLLGLNPVQDGGEPIRELIA